MTTKTADISHDIKTFIVRRFIRDRHQLGDDDHLLGTGVIDSLGILDLLAYLQTQFAIVIADDELLPDNFASVARLTRFVTQKLAAGATS
jgi:acyl carrier protein